MNATSKNSLPAVISTAQRTNRNRKRLPSRIERILDHFRSMHNRVRVILVDFVQSQIRIGFAEEIFLVQLLPFEMQRYFFFAGCNFFGGDN